MHLASGNVPVSRTTVADGFKGTDQTVAIMSKIAMGKYGARSAKIRALAINIINAAGVKEKDYLGEAMALGTWVRDTIKYVRDPAYQETLSHPEETAFNTRRGDCDDQSVLLAALMGSVGIQTRFKVIGQTPFNYSHVYMQAMPKGEWITFDPIMSDKPCGWEVPRTHRAIEKTYPLNGPEGLDTMGVGNLQGHGMGRALGYIAESRVESPLESAPVGVGPTPRRPAGSPAYVQMPALLEPGHEPVAWMAAFPPDQNMPDVYPTQRARNIAPQMRSIAPGNSLAPGVGEMYGPDALASLNVIAKINQQNVPAHFTAKTVRAAPEGVDAAFSRASLVMDDSPRDLVDYDGQASLARRGIPRPVRNLAGDAPSAGAPMPGRVEDLPGGRAPAPMSKMPIFVATLAIAAGILLYRKRNKRQRR